MASNEYSLEVEGLGKSYRMYQSPFRRITEVLTRGKIKGHQEFTALNDVNFKMRPGTSLGLCGANGAASRHCSRCWRERRRLRPVAIV